MSNLRKALEAKKADILSEAQQRAAEIDNDIEQLERLTAKYGLSVIEPSTSHDTGVESEQRTEQTDHPMRRNVAAALADLNGNGTAHPVEHVVHTFDEALKAMYNASVTKRARVAAEAYIREKNRPVPLGELYKVLADNGIEFQSDTPRNTLSAVLGQTDNLYSISRGQGWWIKDLPLPEIRRRSLS
jgi:hypothetical protein